MPPRRILLSSAEHAPADAPHGLSGLLNAPSSLYAQPVRPPTNRMQPAPLTLLEQAQSTQPAFKRAAGASHAGRHERLWATAVTSAAMSDLAASAASDAELSERNTMLESNGLSFEQDAAGGPLGSLPAVPCF